jgi:multidrug efflux pump subunit AcrB
MDVFHQHRALKSLIPQDIKITYEFDQSQYVRAALFSVLREGLIGLTV